MVTKSEKFHATQSKIFQMLRSFSIELPYLLDMCHTAVLFKGFIFVSGNNFNCIALSDNTAPYLTYTLITSIPIPVVSISISMLAGNSLFELKSPEDDRTSGNISFCKLTVYLSSLACLNFNCFGKTKFLNKKVSSNVL